MKILLIAPASGKWRHVGRSRLFNGKTFRFSLLSLLSVAAETPERHRVVIVDEQIDDVPFEEDWDLVGITAMTAGAPRAYELAGAFRARGIPVVLGGMHGSFLPDEALEHVDAVVAGDAEGAWPRLLEDLEAGRLACLYRSEEPPSLAGLKRPPRELLDGEEYSTVQAVQASRGCPNTCAFCSVSAFHQGKQRRRPVEEAAAEVAALPGKFFMLIDDSLAADPDYAKRLLRAFIPLRKHWMSQVTLKVTDDAEMVRLMAESGCVGVFVGLETFSGENLDGVDKGFNRVEEYRERIRVLHRHGIGVEAGVVLGFDADGPGAFSRTLDALDELEIDMAQISILTPLPGTRFFRRMEHRILDRDWGRYDFHHVVFQPRHLSTEALQAGHDWLTREFYSPVRIAYRLARLLKRPHGRRLLPYAAVINLAYLGRVLRWRIRGFDPAAQGVSKPAGWDARVPARAGVR